MVCFLKVPKFLADGCEGDGVIGTGPVHEDWAFVSKLLELFGHAGNQGGGG